MLELSNVNDPESLDGTRRLNTTVMEGDSISAFLEAGTFEDHLGSLEVSAPYDLLPSLPPSNRSSVTLPGEGPTNGSDLSVD